MDDKNDRKIRYSNLSQHINFGESSATRVTGAEDETDSEEINSQTLDGSLSPMVSRDSIYANQKGNELGEIVGKAFASILEDSVDQLRILGSLGNFPQISMSIDYQSVSEKFGGGEMKGKLYDSDTIEPYEAALAEQRLIKFQKDRKYFETILHETCDELSGKKQTYQILMKRLGEYETAYIEEKLLKEEALANRRHLQKLENLLEKEKIQLILELQKACEQLGVLKDTIEDVHFENGVKLRYLESWEDARDEQNEMLLDKKEDGYTKIINNSKTSIEREIRIDGEIESFITEVQREYEDDIQNWMDRYDSEIELRDMEIQVMKEKREEQFLRLEEVSKLYELHKSQIEDYLAYKEKCRLEQELLEKMTKAAIKIQAWWRGTMYRKKLGPYRKKKGKKGDKKKKGKK